MGSLIGFLGQKGFNALDARHTESLISSSSDLESENKTRDPFWRRAMQSKYSPVKHLSDEEYKKVLEDKLLRVDAEIAVLDDDIAALRKADETSSERLK
jgi:hypothetical protein